MAVRARPDNLSLVDPAVSAGTGASPVDFEELWEHRESLRAICLRMVDDPGTADDLVQETFVRALQHADTLDKRASFAPWLATVARRRSIDEIRFRRRLRLMATTPDVVAVDSAEDPAEQVLKQDMIRRLQTALGELSNRERQLLLRQVTHGLTLAELAEEEDTSIASVRSVLSRARTKLRGSLERGGPLGAAPLPRLIAAIKRRLHRVAARLEGHLPVVAGAGAQFGDVVAAVVAAAVLLVVGTTPPAASTDLHQGGIPVAAVSDIPIDKGPAAEQPSPESAEGDQVPMSPADSPAPEQAPTDLAQWSGVPLPPLPDGPSSQPEDSNITSFAASGDGETVFAVGLARTSGQDKPLYRSNDGGTSWQRVDTGTMKGTTVLVPPGYPRDHTLYTVDSNGALYRSDDHGRTFRLVVPAQGLTGFAAMAPGYSAGDERIILTTPRFVQYESGAPAATPIGAGPPVVGLGGMALSPRFADDGGVLVGASVLSTSTTLVGAVYRCSITSPSCTESTTLPGIDRSVAVHVSTSVPGVIVAYGGNRLYRSTDGARTFAEVAIPRLSLKHVTDGGPGELLLAATNHDKTASSGLLRSTDGGLTWVSLGRETALVEGATSVIRLSSGRIIAGLRDSIGGVLCSADGGATWAPRCPAS